MTEDMLLSLLEEYQSTGSTEARNRVIEGYLPLAKSIGRRFSGRGCETEDLEQVASLALIKAVDRFRAEKGVRFISFALPTISGEVRNYLRDKSYSMRMPHDFRSQMAKLTQAMQRFEQLYFRSPTPQELADVCGTTAEEVLVLLTMQSQSESVSLQSEVAGAEDCTLEEIVGKDDSGFIDIENRDWMNRLLAEVSPQEKELLLLRCRDGLGQRETAGKLGVSQMQVSRMERRVLARLRAMEAHSI